MAATSAPGSSQAQRRVTASIWRRSYLPAYLMVLPTVILFLVYMAFPIIYVFYSSLLDWNGLVPISKGRFIGLANYQKLLTDAYWWQSVKLTILYALIKLIVELPVSLLIALMLNAGLRGATLFRTIGFLPVVTSIAVVSLAFTFFFAPIGGPFNTLLMKIGVLDRPIAFLGNRQYAFWTVTGVAIWHDLGINMVFFLAALQTVGRELYEAASVDGANRRQQFFNITVPAIRAMTITIITLSLAGSLKVFDYFAVMTGGGPSLSTMTMVLYMFRYTTFGGGGLTGATTVPTVGYGSAVAIGLGVVILVAVMLQQGIGRLQQR